MPASAAARRRLVDLLAERTAAVAVEAALVFPVIIVLLLGTVDIVRGLDARRTVHNAGYSLAQGTAAIADRDGMIRAEHRARLGNGLALSLDTAALANVRVSVLGIVQEQGATRQDWRWDPGDAAGVVAADLRGHVSGMLTEGEGVVVTVVEGRYQPLFAAAALLPIEFRAVYARVPVSHARLRLR